MKINNVAYRSNANANATCPCHVPSYSNLDKRYEYIVTAVTVTGIVVAKPHQALRQPRGLKGPLLQQPKKLIQ